MNRSPLAIAICSALNTHLAVCALELEIDPRATEIQLMPAGNFRARDGRPKEAAAWVINASVARQVVARAEQRKTPFVIDYDHQTISAQSSGNPAPAAGWFEKLEWREGDGLYAVDVAWTPKAQEYLAKKEYRFISPVFTYAKDGRVVELLMAAITNFPALDGMSEILAAASASFIPKNQPEEPEMDLAKLRKLLGLADDADEAAIMAALTTLVDAKTAADTQVAQLTTQLEQAGNPDPAKYVPVKVVEDLKTELATLTTRINDDEVAELVAQGIDSKKLLPAQKEWATELGKTNVASLRTYLDNAQPIAVLSGGQTKGKQPGDAPGVADESLVAVCSQMGLDPKDVVKEEA